MALDLGLFLRQLAGDFVERLVDFVEEIVAFGMGMEFELIASNVDVHSDSFFFLSKGKLDSNRLEFVFVELLNLLIDIVCQFFGVFGMPELEIDPHEEFFGLFLGGLEGCRAGS